MIESTGDNEFSFLETLSVPWGKREKNTEVKGEQNWQFPA